jgi:alanyl-tRNA synthetase
LVQLKDKERELEELKLKMAGGSTAASTAKTVAGVSVHVQRTDGLDVNGMRTLADQLRDKLKSGVIALGAASGDGKVSLLVVVTKDLIDRLKAGELIKIMAAEAGGSGGGRPEMAQAGGKDPAKLDAALEKVFGLVERAMQR